MRVPVTELQEGMRFAEWKVITGVEKKGRRVLVSTLDDWNDIDAVSDFHINDCPTIINVSPDCKGGYVIHSEEEERG